MLAVACIAPGCTLSEKIAVDDTGAPIYEHLHIVYEHQNADSALQSPTSEQAGAADIEPVDWQESAWPVVRLEISYPHPQAPSQFGRATVVYSDRPLSAANGEEPPGGPRGSGLERRSVWRNKPASAATATHAVAAGPGDRVRCLDIPKLELDLLLVDLANSGFFDDQERVAATGQLDVTINRGRVAKRWTREARLDYLTSLVNRYGESDR